MKLFKARVMNPEQPLYGEYIEVVPKTIYIDQDGIYYFDYELDIIGEIKDEGDTCETRLGGQG